MKIITSGITRTVFVFKNFVIKVPKIRYGWYYFLLGLTSNIEERKTWNAVKNIPNYSKLLCPIKWASKTGFILIMERADIEMWELDPKRTKGPGWSYAEHINAGFGGDDKADNYGYYQDRLVKVDYPNFGDETPREKFKMN